jgi:hypothetical protein
MNAFSPQGVDVDYQRPVNYPQIRMWFGMVANRAVLKEGRLVLPVGAGPTGELDEVVIERDRVTFCTEA